jgi:AAA+ ATPase superfamily predicted ATPase
MPPVRFVGRTAELATLAEAYASSESAFVPVYGRRRVGKSELILRFLQERPGVYFLGKQAPAALQRREFQDEAAAALGEPLLATASFDGWKSALMAVTERWQRRDKLVLVFDEFQWTAWASPELPSVLQELWDRRWRASGTILLILCGSYVGFMEREVLGRRSPLFGRRTAQIQLRPFGYREAALFHPSYSAVDRARAYFLCGGVPWYLGRFDARRSIEGNVLAGVLAEHAPLRHEPEFLLREELREVESYFAVLLAVAEGRTTPREISAATGIGERSLHYYLQQLVELGYVRRRYPLSEQPVAARHVRFALDDPLLRFWFRFVFPNTSYLAQMGPERTLKDRIRPGLDAYLGSCFENLCREALPHLYAREQVAAAFEVGEYWDKRCQLDVVGLRQDGWTDLGECRWGPVRSARQVRDDLDGKVGLYPNRRNATIGRRIFTRDPAPRQRARPGDPEVRWHDLADLYR